jgi:hypothetical protein
MNPHMPHMISNHYSLIHPRANPLSRSFPGGLGPDNRVSGQDMATPRKQRRERSASDKASRTFIRNLVWVVVVCCLFLAGQGLRYGFKLAQLGELREETVALYASVLGPDIGGSPFGRLQFEHGKLAATERIGLDPLSVLAALSRPAPEDVRLEGLVLDGMRGRARGFFGPAVDRFEQYVQDLMDDEVYAFSLERREDVFGGITFSLLVEVR